MIEKLAPVVIVAAVALAGCAGVEMQRQQQADEAVNNVPPKDYRAEVLALMRTYLNDPTQVREAGITEPAIRDIRGNRYALCLRYNARDAAGKYIGVRDSLVTFRLGRLDRIVDNGREQCKDAAYQPFPELQTLTR